MRLVHRPQPLNLQKGREVHRDALTEQVKSSALVSKGVSVVRQAVQAHVQQPRVVELRLISCSHTQGSFSRFHSTTTNRGSRNISPTKIYQGQELISKVLLQSDFFCSALVQREVISDVDVTGRRRTDAQSTRSSDMKTRGLYLSPGSCASKAAKSSKAVKSSISVMAFLSASSSSMARSV